MGTPLGDPPSGTPLRDLPYRTLAPLPSSLSLQLTRNVAHLDICMYTGMYDDKRDGEEQDCATLLDWRIAIGENTTDGDE